MSVIHNKAKKKAKLLKRQRGRCWLCGGAMGADATFDHLIPRSKLGGSAAENLKLAHKACNSGRGRSMDPIFIQHDGIVALRHNIRSIGHI